MKISSKPLNEYTRKSIGEKYDPIDRTRERYVQSAGVREL